MVKTKKLTPEEELVIPPDGIGELIGKFDGGLNAGDDGAVGAFLLLLHSMAHCDPSEREFYCHEAERVLLTPTLAFEEATEKLLRSASDSVRGVRRVEVKLRPKAK